MFSTCQISGGNNVSHDAWYDLYKFEALFCNDVYVFTLSIPCYWHGLLQEVYYLI